MNEIQSQLTRRLKALQGRVFRVNNQGYILEAYVAAATLEKGITIKPLYPERIVKSPKYRAYPQQPEQFQYVFCYRTEGCLSKHPGCTLGTIEEDLTAICNNIEDAEESWRPLDLFSFITPSSGYFRTHPASCPFYSR